MHNGWPGEGVSATDLSLVLQLEDPDPAVSGENAALASAHLPFSASSGQTVTAAELPPDQNGNPFFGGAVRVSSHVNLHARLFVERTNAVGPILGAALNTVIGQFLGRIPLLATPAREVLHIQIGKVIATELARATAIVPVDATFRGSHPVTLALVAPRDDSRHLRPAGEPRGLQEGRHLDGGRPHGPPPPHARPGAAGLRQLERRLPTRISMHSFLAGAVLATSGDITRQNVDAIVNAANSSLLGGGGVDGAIHRAGGPAILAACQELRRTVWPSGLPTGEAVITPAGDLPARFVIHTVGPVYGSHSGDEAALLACCYRKSLFLAEEHGLHTIAFPAISTGVYGYPRPEAAEVAPRRSPRLSRSCRGFGRSGSCSFRPGISRCSWRTRSSARP